jgi:hypothetical protein
MKLNHDTIAAILSVVLIATTCILLLIGGLNMIPGSHNQHGSHDLSASTNH